MRTTLDIDADVLQAAKEIAAVRKITTGQAISDLARRALTLPVEKIEYRNGFRVLPRRGGVVTTELVERLLAESGD